MAHKRITNPVGRITLVTMVAMALIVTDVFFVSVRKVHLRSGTDLRAYAEDANTVKEDILASRGTIYDRNGNIIAQDVRTYNIVCILDSSRPNEGDKPAYVQDREKTAETLAPILKMDKQKILDYLSQGDNGKYQTELGSEGRNLSKEVKEQIEATGLPGIEFTDSVERDYPYGQFASNLIGYADQDEDGKSTVGRMGLELILNSYLQGKDGYRLYQVDKNGYSLPGMKEEHVSAINGRNVYLTLDSTIQQQLENSLQQTSTLFPNVSRAWGAVMEIKTGKIIGWGQYPSFDPNTREEIKEYNNIGAQLPYEAGSTMKSFVWAAAINEGKYNGTDTTNGDDYCFGSDAQGNPVRVPESQAYGCIYNAHKTKYGNVDLDRGLITSLNTVALHIQNEVITPQIHLDYLKKFGFFQPVDTDGLQESSGQLNFNTPADRASLSYGQGSSVTTLQLLQAYSAIFGDGTLIKPYFVDSVRDSYDNSKVIYQGQTEKKGNPITPETAKTMQNILYGTANSKLGTAWYYQIPETKILSKTGTTEVASGGTYNTNQTISSLMCAMPADNPQVMVYYAYQSDYTKESVYKTDPVTSLLRKVAMVYGFTNENNSDKTADQQPIADIQNYEMPSLLNHTVTYSQNALQNYGSNVIVLGNGNTVIDQYPKAGNTVETGQRVFLLTDTASFTMPDMTGWTRKDVSALWAVTGFSFKISGEGKVTSQSVPAGTAVTRGTEIEVVLSQ